jgi:hypothetical protein
VRVIPPLTITDAMLTSSTVAEPDSGAGEAAWNSGTTYAANDRVIRTTTHRIYESKAGGNLNHDPATDTTETYWLDVGPTNRWAMFDLLRNTGTTDGSPLTVVITPGARIDAIAVVGIEADSISISMTSSAVSVYSYTEDLRTRETLDWYDYFFGEFEQKSAVALFDLPPYTNGVITVTLTRATGDCTCGGVVLGQSVDLGSTIHGAENDALNFSKVERDDFGTATLVQRRTIPKTNQQTRIAKLAVNKALKVRQDLNAMPALWSGLDDATSGYFEPLLILGIYKRFTISMDQPEDALISLELEEV